KARLFEEVAAGYSARHPDQRSLVESTTSASYSREVWTGLDEATRRMLVSGEMYALHQTADMDFSGPLLVLCAACERELNRRLFTPMATHFESELAQDGRALFPPRPTLGQAVFLLRQSAALLLATDKGQHRKVARLIESAPSHDEAKMWQHMTAYLKAR